MTWHPIKLKDLPYLSHLPVDGRSVMIVPMLDEGGVWHLYIQRQDGLFLVMHPNDVTMTFVASNPPLTSTDAFLPLSNLVFQHLSYPDTVGILNRLESDFVNSLASIHKYFVLAAYAKQTPSVPVRCLITTELEFAFQNHRAFYDLLKNVLTSVLKKCIVVRTNGKQSKPPELKDSFNGLTQKTDEELAAKFSFPPPLVQFVQARRGIFTRICKMRDNIIHHGHSIDFICETPEGFALPSDDKLWKEFKAMNIWPDDTLKQNGLASVLGLLVFLAKDMLEAMTELAAALTNSHLALPTPIAPAHKVYLRNPLMVHCGRLAEYRNKQWLDPTIVLSQSCNS